ncbi:DciA family protein (plasmid) [Streptomyces uncialis]|uniref:DciA family protein n=1 Tax=Streptomyces uncialis TaxID=1048205 RepID=UPI002E2F393F|nr:DciA family protein [Streptomyces uncialis]
MTDTTVSSSEEGLSGVDLARVALANARATAKSAPVQKRRTGASSRRARGSGRDPLPFGAAITQMMAARGWDMAARGGSVLDQWPAIAPELAGKVAAASFEEETRTLHLRPCSGAYRTQLTLHQQQIIAKVNAAVGDGTVRHLKILAPGGVDTPTTPATPVPGTTPVREEPAPTGQPTGPRPQSPGYLAALTAHQEHRTTRDSGMDARVRAAAESQTRRLRRNREPEEAFTEIAAQEEILREQHARAHASDSLEASVRAALAHKRRESVAASPYRLSAAS